MDGMESEKVFFFSFLSAAGWLLGGEGGVGSLSIRVGTSSATTDRMGADEGRGPCPRLSNNGFLDLPQRGKGWKDKNS